MSDGQSFVRVHVSVSFFFLLSRLGPALACPSKLPYEIVLFFCETELAGHARPLFDWEKVFSARFITYVLFFNSRLVSTLGAVHKRRRQLGEGGMEGSKMGQKCIKIADR